MRSAYKGGPFSLIPNPIKSLNNNSDKDIKGFLKSRGAGAYAESPIWDLDSMTPIGYKSYLYQGYNTKTKKHDFVIKEHLKYDNNGDEIF